MARRIGRRWGAVATALFVATSVFVATSLLVPAPAPARPNEPARPIPPLFEVDDRSAMELLRQTPYGDRFLQDLEASYRRLVSDDQQGVQTERFGYGFPAGDLNRDGHNDVGTADITIRFEIDEENFDVSFRTTERYTMRDGRTGKVLWSYQDKVEDGFIAFAPTAVGREGRDGALAILIEGFSFSAGFEHVVVTSLSGPRGRVLWQREYQATSVANDDLLTGTTVTHGATVSISLFDGIEGRATELLLGNGTIISTPSTIICDIGAIVVDGRNGNEHIHPAREKGFDWIPYPSAVQDLDGDGLDDYIVANRNQIVILPGGGEPGDDDIVEITDVIRARQGPTGDEIWFTTDVDIGWALWDMPVWDAAGKRGPDIVVATWIYEEPPLITVPLLFPEEEFTDRIDAYLLDGGSGRVQWKRPGEWAYDIGDINRDGFNDVVTATSKHVERDSRSVIVTTLRAFAPNGKRLYLRKHRLSAPLPTCPARRAVCFAYSVSLTASVGDLHPDGHRDLGMWMFVADSVEDVERKILIDGTSGRRIRTLDEHTWWESRSFDERGDDLTTTRWSAEDGGYLAAIDGRDMSRLWAARFTASETLLPRQVELFGVVARLDRDGCADVVTNVWTGDAATILVMDGGNGRTKWQAPIFGNERIGARARDLDPAC